MVEQVEFPVLILWQAHTHVSDLLTNITPTQTREICTIINL